MTKPSEVARWAYGLGSSIITHKQIISVTWQGFQVIGSYNLPIVRYTMHSSVDLSSIVADNVLITSTCTDPNNGTFKIIAVNNTNHTVDVVNFTRNNNAYDETSLTTSYADFYTSAALINKPTNTKAEQGFLSPEKPADGLINWILNNHGEWINWIDTAFSGFVTEYSTISDLRNVDTADVGNGSLAYVVSIDAIYRYKDSLTVTNDNEFFVTPLVGSGAWEKFIVTPTDLKSQIEAEMNTRDKKQRDLIQRIEILEGI